jgi:hypothetical protein
MFWSVMGGVMAGNFVTFVVRCALGAWVREKRAREGREVVVTDKMWGGGGGGTTL